MKLFSPSPYFLILLTPGGSARRGGSGAGGAGSTRGAPPDCKVGSGKTPAGGDFGVSLSPCISCAIGGATGAGGAEPQLRHRTGPAPPEPCAARPCTPGAARGSPSFPPSLPRAARPEQGCALYPRKAGGAAGPGLGAAPSLRHGRGLSPDGTGRGSALPSGAGSGPGSAAPPHPHLTHTAGGPGPGPGPSSGQEAPPAAALLRALLLMQLKFHAKPLQNRCGGEGGLFSILLPAAFPILPYEIKIQSLFFL